MGGVSRVSLAVAGVFDYQHFIEGDLAFKYAEEALRQALVNLDAIEAPAGPMMVVLRSLGGLVCYCSMKR